MGTALGRPLASAGHRDAKDASRSRFREIRASAGRQRRTLNVQSLAAYLPDFRQVLGSKTAGNLYAHRIPIAATLPDIRKLTGGERDAPLLRDAV